MSERSREALTPLATLDEEAAAYLARVLTTLLLAVIVVLVLVTFLPLGAGALGRRLGIAGAGVLLSAGALVLVHRRRIATAVAVFTFGAWLLTTVAAFTAGGVRAPVYMAYSAVIVFAALLLRRWSVFLALFVSILSGWAMAQAELIGRLRPPLIHPTSVWATQSAVLVAIAALAWAITGGLREALTRVRAEVAERKRAEGALHESEEQYRRFLRLSAENIWRLVADPPVPIDLDAREQAELILQRARIAECNDAMARRYGFPRPEDMVGLRLADLWAATHEVRIGIVLRFVQSGYRVTDMESTGRYPDGAQAWFLNNLVGIVEEGHLVQAWGTQRDITARKHMEAALRDSEGRYRSLVETTSDWIWETDAHIVYTYASPRVKDLLGYDSSEIIGRTPFDLMPPDEAERIAALVRPCFENAQPFSHLVNRNLHKDGRVIVLETSGVPVLDNRGRLRAFRGIDRDITEKQQAEEARERLQAEMDRQRALLEAVFESVEMRLACLDRNFNFLRVNAAYARTGRRAPEAFLGHNHFEFYPHAENEAIFRHVRDTGEPFEMREKPFEHPDQPERGITYWDWALRPITGEDGTVEMLVLSLLDVTESVRQRERLLAAERARADLAEHLRAEIDHRTRNNLAMVTGILHVQASQESDPTVAFRLREAAARIRTFVDIHERIYAAGPEQVDLFHVLRQMTVSLGTLFPEAAAIFSVEGVPVLCPTRDATNLAVLTNELITNALKHGQPGPDGRLHVTVQLVRGEEDLRLSVRNSGVPVPEGFDVSAQSGLGLRLVSRVIEQYRGSFTLRPVEEGNLAELVIPYAALQP